MDFIKKQRIGFWAYLITAVMAAVSLAVYVANVNSAYYQDMNGRVVVMMVLALLFLAAALVLPQLAQGKPAAALTDALRAAAAVLIILSGTAFIAMRVESFGYIFGSNLELGNEAAFSAGTQAVTGIILFMATWLLSVAAAFLEVDRKDA